LFVYIAKIAVVFV